jgi:hypothetical protein
VSNHGVLTARVLVVVLLLVLLVVVLVASRVAWSFLLPERLEEVCQLVIEMAPGLSDLIEARDGNSGTGTGYPPGTRPDGDGHGYHFSPMGGAHTQPGVRRVRGGDLILPMGNLWVPVKQSQTQQNISVSAQHSAQPNIPHPTGAA